jgi:acetyltransferase-like isoleucine patch superfamily enzyme
MAALFTPGYKGRVHLARITSSNYASRSAVISPHACKLGNNVFLGDRVVLYSKQADKSIVIDDKTCLHNDTIIETGEGGRVEIGHDTHIQPRCQLSAYKGSILIGSNVQIAPGCGFYPYNHGMAASKSMREQELVSRGNIVIGDDVWIGYGVTVLENVKVGDGAVIAAGSVVREDVPAGGIVAGVPATLVGQRR